MKLLLLEDNERFAKLIKDVLQKEGYKVDWLSDGEEALEALANGYHCYILDINVPSLDGISILEALRIYHKDTPVIIISSNHDLEKIQKSYELGCDDYLKKPFFVYELVQKVKKLLSCKKNVVNLWNGYSYDINSKRLYQNQKDEIKLAKKEILFLELFIKDKKRIISHEELEEYVWEGQETNIENIRALIKRLRKKLPKGAIESVKDMGYTLGKI